MSVSGLESLLSNLEAAERRLVEGRIEAAREICALLEAWAKTYAPFQDQTGNLRNSIRADLESVSEDMVVILLTAGMEYAPYVELRWGERYAFLRPAVEANVERMIEIVQRHCGAR